MINLSASDAQLRQYLLHGPQTEILSRARRIRDERFGTSITYSRKVFIPLTQLCRNVCHYCTFAQPPRHVESPYLSPEQVLDIARQGAAAGCKEALFTLGDKPELRYPGARLALADLGFSTTLEYLEYCARLVLVKTGLLPHINAGVLSRDDYARLRPVSASMGLMLESNSDRLCQSGQAHHGSPDKAPKIRLASLAAAGSSDIPTTSGILIGIGESRAERTDALLALRRLHNQYGHLQEVIIQNFRAKAGTRMADAPEPSHDDLLWTIAAARLVFENENVSVQSPPNLSPGHLRELISAGLNDFGGISPVTIDHVNPEAPWPKIEHLAAQCADEGFTLVERLAIYPPFISASSRWLDKGLHNSVRILSDASGLAREHDWSPGIAGAPPGQYGNPLALHRAPSVSRMKALDRCLAELASGRSPGAKDVTELFSARGAEARDILSVADGLRRASCGDDVTFVVNRNINYTNICTFSCSFCAFSKASTKVAARDRPYDLPHEEIGIRARDAWERGATEVCLQGGIHPGYSGETYLSICRVVKTVCPDIHIHAFSPLEIAHGAETLGMDVEDFLLRLKEEGLASMPGTAAEILDDDVRSILCPDKLTSARWIEVIEAAHRIGLPTTATIMFGALETHQHWANHILSIRQLQSRTGGITEFVPLPFVHMQAPVFLKGQARKGPTWRETVLMHAVSRIVLHGMINNIQASWVKLGLQGAACLLEAGVNDLGGVLMNESISRAAGATHGQNMTREAFDAVVSPLGRKLKQRNTLYNEPFQIQKRAQQ